MYLCTCMPTRCNKIVDIDYFAIMVFIVNCTTSAIVLAVLTCIMLLIKNINCFLCLLLATMWKSHPCVNKKKKKHTKLLSHDCVLYSWHTVHVALFVILLSSFFGAAWKKYACWREKIHWKTGSGESGWYTYLPFSLSHTHTHTHTPTHTHIHPLPPTAGLS